jgi:nucleotide-binding universal stress UspA family protein
VTGTPTVVAALDTISVARGVLMSALALAERTGGEVSAVHAVGNAAEPLESLAAVLGVPLRQLSGPPGPAILEAIEADGVRCGVLGTRERRGRGRAVGSVTRYLLERTTKPVVVVPPETGLAAPLRRVLVPLEGTEASSIPVLLGLGPLLGDVEAVVLHVFTEATLPKMLDRPYRDLELLGQEFLTEHCPVASAIELRAGPIAQSVAEVSAAHGAQLVVLSWHQEPAAGRARVLRELLETAALPVMVLPAPG